VVSVEVVEHLDGQKSKLNVLCARRG
jgi:hypothetical protein